MPKRDPDSFKMIFQDWVDFEVSQRLVPFWFTLLTQLHIFVEL